jgi:hypothetical protein
VNQSRRTRLRAADHENQTAQISHPSPAGGNLFDLAGEFYVPSRQPPMSAKAEHSAIHTRNGITSPNYPRWFFRTLRPAREDFDQKINSGNVERVFNPQALAR